MDIKIQGEGDIASSSLTRRCQQLARIMLDRHAAGTAAPGDATNTPSRPHKSCRRVRHGRDGRAPPAPAAAQGAAAAPIAFSAPTRPASRPSRPAAASCRHRRHARARQTGRRNMARHIAVRRGTGIAQRHHDFTAGNWPAADPSLTSSQPPRWPGVLQIAQRFVQQFGLRRGHSVGARRI